MSSINGVLNALLNRFKFDGRRVTPTQDDQRIAKRAEGLIKNLLLVEEFEDIEYNVSIADWRVVDAPDAIRSSGLSQAMAAADVDYSPEPSTRTQSADLDHRIQAENRRGL